MPFDIQPTADSAYIPFRSWFWMLFVRQLWVILRIVELCRRCASLTLMDNTCAVGVVFIFMSSPRGGTFSFLNRYGRPMFTHCIQRQFTHHGWSESTKSRQLPVCFRSLIGSLEANTRISGGRALLIVPVLLLYLKTRLCLCFVFCWGESLFSW